MSLSPAPILHNGVLSTTFNASDFNNASKLNSPDVTGPLTVSGLATFNSGTQVNGTENVTGAVVCNTSTVNVNQTVGGTSAITGLTTCTGGLTLGTSSTLTLPSTQSINNGITLVDTTSAQTMSGAKTFSTSLKTPLNTVISSSNDVVDTANVQTISGAKTFSGLPVFSSGIQLPTPALINALSAVPVISCNNKSSASFTLTMAYNITGFGFSNIRAGGTYTIFVTGGSSVYTISNALTGGNPASFKTNFGGSALSIPISGSVILNCFYDGTTMYATYVSYA